jgi:hypothetical protein
MDHNETKVGINFSKNLDNIDFGEWNNGWISENWSGLNPSWKLDKGWTLRSMTMLELKKRDTRWTLGKLKMGPPLFKTT